MWLQQIFLLARALLHFREKTPLSGSFQDPEPSAFPCALGILGSGFINNSEETFICHSKLAKHIFRRHCLVSFSATGLGGTELLVDSELISPKQFRYEHRDYLEARPA